MINRVSNFLDEPTLLALRQKYESARGTPSFEVNNMGRWGAGLESGSYAPVLILPLEDYKEYFLEKYKSVHPDFADHRNLTVFMHIWLPGSQINFHHDDSSDRGNPRLSSTIYINERWNWNWGGLFLYDDPDSGQGWVYPHSNSMVWFRPPIYHATSMITMDAEFPRLSIQLFFNKY
jgi:hypothetical protein